MTEQIIGKSFLIQKAWTDDATQDTHIEGWLSTPALDKEKHITQPEAFLPVMETYFSNYAPISYHHGTDVLPAGHLQKAAVVRDGKIIKSVQHPTNPDAEFKHFDGAGSGVYVHGVINDAFASSAIQKGNVGCFSFIGHASGEIRDDGVTVWNTLTDWMESTVSPYPVNTQATFRIAKAHGYTLLEKDTPTMTEDEMKQISEMIVKAIAPAATPPATPPPTVPPVASPAAGFTAEHLATSLAVLKTDILTHVDGAIEAKLTKAATDRGTGVGTKAAIPADGEALDAVDAVLKKASTVNAEDLLRNSIDPITGEYRTFELPEFTPEEQTAANHMTWKYLFEGMRDD